MAILSHIKRNVLEKTTFKVVLISLFTIIALYTARPCFGQQSDTITYTYDNLNRLTQVIYSSGASITYTYDAAGNRTSTQTSGGSTTSALSISNVSPPAGQVTGGQQIKLSGSFVGLSTVMMGGVSASWNFTNGTSEITVTTPPHAVGAVAIDLIPSTGVTISKANAFAYLPTVFTDDAIVVGVTMAKAQHVIELRQAVDALRAVAKLAPASWTESALAPTSTTIKAIHIQELRSYLEEAAVALGFTATQYTDPTLGAGSVIKRIHIEELRGRIRAFAQFVVRP